MENELDLLGNFTNEGLENDDQIFNDSEETEQTQTTDVNNEEQQESQEEFKYFPEETEEANTSESETTETKPSLSALDVYLQGLGITDTSKVLWDSEDGNGPQEVDFHSLSQEDQLTILQSNNIDKVLDPLEIETINYFRENEVTLEEYTQFIQRKAVEDYMSSQQAQITVNDLTDEELFKLDLLEQNKLLSEDHRMTEEEIDNYWESVKSSPILEKQLKILRETYLESEKRFIEEQELIQTQEQQKEFLNLATEIRDLSRSIDTIEDITLEDSDKQIIEDLLLKRDVNGVTGLAKALNDPQTLYTTAWFLTKGSEAFSMIKNYYTKRLQDVEKEAYEAGRASMKPKANSTPPQTGRQLNSNKKVSPIIIGKHDI